MNTITLSSDAPERIERREFDHQGLWGTTEFNEAVETAIASLNAYGRDYDTWVVTYSGGKDSSAVLTFVLWAIEEKLIPKPQKLVALYADTGMELPPLAITARQVLGVAAQKGATTGIVQAPIEKRLYVQMLGRGLPYPTNRRRWCTRVLKQEPMTEAMKAYPDALVITGVRKGESDVRDAVIGASCSTGDGECGQGWYQQSRNALAPFMSWRQCHIWRWLYSDQNPIKITSGIEAIYKADDLMDDLHGNAGIRTGCIKCQVVHDDVSFRHLVKLPEWSWLAPYHELDQLHEWLAEPAQRLRKVIPSVKSDGSLRDRHGAPVGPIHIEARKEGLKRLLDMQCRVAELSPDGNGYPIVSEEEITMIETMWSNRIYPKGWNGTEPHADELHVKTFVKNGEIIGIQRPLFDIEIA